MVNRTYWLTRLGRLWKSRSVIWLSGVRRAGKTCLARSVPDVEWIDCELPRQRRSLEDPEEFLERRRGRAVALDEVHRLPDPSTVLKIAADHYPDVRILATGSSTLGASARFRDTLAGRKGELWLTPMVNADLRDFGGRELEHRLLRGGLPAFYLAEDNPEPWFQEWMEAYWAKDIQELFRLERRVPFQRLLELTLARSGGIVDQTRLARECEVSRGTIANYLAVLEATYVVHLVRPFSTHRATEILKAPKAYGFDTGFVCYHRGWYELRREDLGLLFEHYVLNELHAEAQARHVAYWRDKQGHEVDFVLAHRRPDRPLALECKYRADQFEDRGLRAFRRMYPEGDNLVVCADVDEPFVRTYGALEVRFIGVAHLPDAVALGRTRTPDGAA